jgi:hypothetical protein
MIEAPFHLRYTLNSRQIDHLRAAMERGRTPEGFRAVIERGRRIEQIMRGG